MTAICLRVEHGPAHHAPQWVAPVVGADAALLARAVGPVLDVGCGPGRHVVELARRGLMVLGIDVSLPALELALRRGAPVLHRSVFEDVPGIGRWSTALLLDGNLGIGGCPRTLLTRVGELLHSDGRMLLEAHPSTTPSVVKRVRVEVDGHPGPWFHWARVSADAVPDLAADAGFVVVDRWTADGRWFAELHRSPQSPR